MAVPVEFWYFIGSGVVLMWIVIMFMNFILGGLLGPFMKVKASRGSKVLVRVRNPIQDYFRAGSIEEGYLVFKDKQKTVRRINMKSGVVSRAATIYWVEVDDEKNCLFMRSDGSAIATHDPAKTDSLLTRALYKPGLLGDNTIKIILLLVIITFVGVLAVGYLVFKQSGMIQQIQQAMAVGTSAVIA